MDRSPYLHEYWIPCVRVEFCCQDTWPFVKKLTVFAGHVVSWSAARWTVLTTRGRTPEDAAFWRSMQNISLQKIDIYKTYKHNIAVKQTRAT